MDAIQFTLVEVTPIPHKADGHGQLCILGIPITPISDLDECNLGY